MTRAFVVLILLAAWIAFQAEVRQLPAADPPAAPAKDGTPPGANAAAPAPAAPTKPKDAKPKESVGKPNLATPTWGGKQFWTDELLFQQWRIQRNVFTSDYRLLDEDNVRQARGLFEDCRKKLDLLKAEKKLPPMTGKVVILLHGLGRSRTATQSMARFVGKADFTTLEFGYASTREDVAQHARSLARVIEYLPPEVDEIDFVGHSLGNLVVRRYLADATDAKKGTHPDPRIKRIVMLGPPNNGAKLAQLLGDNKIFQTIAGTAGAELGPKWAELQKHLATPECEFGIIAGARPDEKARNPLLQGGDDLVLAVSETKLPGANDFLVLPVVHTFMMDEPKVQEAALKFLLHGYFVSAEKRQPLAKEEAK